MATESEEREAIQAALVTNALASEIARVASEELREVVLDSSLTVFEKAKILGITTARVYQLRPVSRRA
jgi:hypothetical protein